MDKQQIIRKLTSRKFWVAVVGFITLILQSNGMASGSVEQIASLIMAGAFVIAYVFAEGWSDASNAANTAIVNESVDVLTDALLNYAKKAANSNATDTEINKVTNITNAVSTDDIPSNRIGFIR